MEESKDKTTFANGAVDKENFRLDSSNNSILESLNHTPERIVGLSNHTENDRNGHAFRQNGDRSKYNHWNADTSEIKESLQEVEEENNRK